MRVICATLIGGWLAAIAGCSMNPLTMAGSAGKVAFSSIRGAEADVTAIEVPDRTALAAYKSLRAGEVTTDVPPICTPEVVRKVGAGLRKGLTGDRARDAFPGGDRTLTVDVLCRFYKGKGVIGGEGRLDWLVTLCDADSREPLASIFVEGVSSSPLQHGAEDMAEENAKELIRYLRKYLKRD